MTDFTTTPNLGLFKPVVDADENLWGDHINFNADKLDQFFGNSTTGPFLPISGGTIEGKLTINGGGLNVKHLPTSATGLVSGDVWINGGFLCIIP